MTDDVRFESADGGGIWTRIVDDDDVDVLGVEVAAMPGEWNFHVTVPAAGFVSDEPPETRLRDAVAAAIAGVPGVARVIEEDREVWLAQGEADGAAIVRAIGAAVDDLADDIRSAMDAY